MGPLDTPDEMGRQAIGGGNIETAALRSVGATGGSFW